LRLDGFIDRFPAAKADAVIEPDGGVILGGHFEQRPAQSGTAKAMQGLEQERAARPRPRSNGVTPRF